MRIVEKLLYGVGGLLALILLFILVCHFKPGLAQDMGETLYAKEPETGAVEIPSQPSQTQNMTPVVAKSADNGIAVIPVSSDTYEAPQESELDIPDIVAGLTGYLPPSDKGKEISEEKADQIAKSLGVGDTGENLSFDEKFYPYYHMLNDTGKALYRQIYANTQAVTKAFAPVVDVSASQIKNAFMAVCNDHPELFWLDTAYSYQYAPTGRIVEIDLSFNYTVNNLEENKAKFEAQAKELIYKTRGLYSDYDKEVSVHDNLISQITYDLQAPINQSAYSALVNGRTVCAGYARAFQYVMQKMEIPCYYVTGFAGENHAWNIIKLDNDYYNVDTTWDDTNPNTRDYFNCSDAEFATDHIRRDLSVYLPPCLGEKYGSDIRKEQEAIRKAQEEAAKAAEEEKKAKEEAALIAEEEEAKEEEELQPVIYTLEQYGFDNSDVIMNIETYYRDCTEQILADGDDNIVFMNVVDNEKLWKEIAKSYEKGDYQSAYMNRILTEKHLSRDSVTITGELLADGSYLIRHQISLK